jgi:glutathione S-transferase
MKLVGHYLSPFTRRIAVSLHALHMPFELEFASTVKDPEHVRRHHPMVRLPSFVLDDGEILIESGAILDEIDQMAGPARALVPPSGPARRRVMQVIAYATGAMDKTQWAFYERRFHPPEKVHQPWIDQNEAQALTALIHLDALAADAGPQGWLAGTKTMSQADITTAVYAGFVLLVREEARTRLPNLSRFCDRCEALAPFKAAPVPPSQAGRPGYLQLPA